MRKRKPGRTLSRTKDQRTALKRTLLVSLTKYGQISTTLAKAKEVRPFIEKMITRAKKATDEQKRVVVMRQLKKDVNAQTARKLIEMADVFGSRTGGYVRIIKLPFRKRDAADMAMIQWTEDFGIEDDVKSKSKSKQSRKDKRQQKEEKKETYSAKASKVKKGKR